MDPTLNVSTMLSCFGFFFFEEKERECTLNSYLLSVYFTG